MYFLIVLVVVVVLILLAINRAKAAKKRIIQQAMHMQVSLSGTPGVPQVVRRGGVTVTVMPPTVEGMQGMSGMAEDVLKAMGGADGIMNMPAVRDALRQASQHPGVTTTVTTSSSSGSPFEMASDPFAQGGSPFDQPVAVPATGGFGTAARAPERGELGIAQVISAPSLAFDGSHEVALELDAIGAPKRRVTATVAQGVDLAVGFRSYVRLDPQDSSKVTLLGGQVNGSVLPAGTNRLDTLVLGPQLFRNGAHGAGVVKAATQVASGVGGGSWQLELEVTPERGWPYRAELLTTVSNVEKAERICVVGAQVPVVYDPDDPKTMCVDSVALGYGNPFAGR